MKREQGEQLSELTGTGRMTSAFPARSAMWRKSGTPFSAAPALHTARDTPRMAFAPNFAKYLSKQSEIWKKL